jgi:hypothetical protein
MAPECIDEPTWCREIIEALFVFECGIAIKVRQAGGALLDCMSLSISKSSSDGGFS